MNRRSFLALGLGALVSTGARISRAQVPFAGRGAGDEREFLGIEFCWCPSGSYVMGSPPEEVERRPGEDQVHATLPRGFWMAKYEATQGQWLRVFEELPGPLTAELPAGGHYPVGKVNFAEAEAYCHLLTVRARQSGVLPSEWESRLPTEALWEYACRAGTRTATAFGDRLSSKQANFKGRPYNGAEAGRWATQESRAPFARNSGGAEAAYCSNSTM